MLHARADAGLIHGSAHDADSMSLWHLSGCSVNEDVLTKSFAWVIETCCNPHFRPFVPALGLNYVSFARLLVSLFPRFTPPQGWLDAQGREACADGTLEEFSDLLQLLLDYRAVNDERHRCVAHLVATACMGSDHLWQDMGLPDRQALSMLLSTYFPALAARNTGDMKWKKFFYRQLCEREGILICKSPSCSTCCDYAKCFGPETGHDAAG